MRQVEARGAGAGRGRAVAVRLARGEKRLVVVRMCAVRRASSQPVHVTWLPLTAHPLLRTTSLLEDPALASCEVPEEVLEEATEREMGGATEEGTEEAAEEAIEEATRAEIGEATEEGGHASASTQGASPVPVPAPAAPAPAPAPAPALAPALAPAPATSAAEPNHWSDAPTGEHFGAFGLEDVSHLL